MIRSVTIEADLPDLFDAAEKHRRNAAKRALDDLFENARMYRSSASFRELMSFIARFRFYSPFNAMLIHTQMRGAKYAAPARKWADKYGRRIKETARPLVILQPMGPVMYVFDVADTEPIPGAGAHPLPTEVERPFEVRRGSVGDELQMTIRNALRDGIEISEVPQGSQHAGFITNVPKGNFVWFQKTVRPPQNERIPLRYRVAINSNISKTARYAALIHELGHLYCGHLGTPNEKWWPDRTGLDTKAREFEAESVCYLACARLGIDNPSDEYLSGYLGHNAEIPPISFDSVLKAAGLVEQMGRENMRLR